MEGKEKIYNSSYEIIYEVDIINGKRFIDNDKRNNNCSIY